MKFEPEMFSGNVSLYASQAAEQAQTLFDRWLDGQRKIYGNLDFPALWTYDRTVESTHSARLIHIEKIPHRDHVYQTKRCGQCNLWMKKRECPKEGGTMVGGPSANTVACEKFEK